MKSKLGYLRRLGITALWVSPPFRQVAFEPSYHGYGIQNFLDVDPHFGTREEFRDFVQAAHEQGIYVILDIVAHHTGNVFTYDPDRYATHDPASGRWYNDPRWDGKPYAVQGFNDRDGRPTLPFDPPDPGRMEAAWPDGAIWPREFQRPDLFLRKGHITNWDYYPEYAEGDMFGLKTLDLRVQWDGQYRQASSALACLGPRLLLLDRLRRPRRLPHRRRQAHGGRGAADLLRRDPGVRPEHRQGELPPGRGDRRQPRARLGGRGEDRAGRGPGDRGRPGQAGADGHRATPTRRIISPCSATGSWRSRPGTAGIATRW